MIRLCRPVAIALLSLAGCAAPSPAPTESDWTVTSVHDLLVEIDGRTKIQILWTEEMKLQEKFVAFPRAGSLWDQPEALLEALRQVLRVHGLNLNQVGEPSIYKIKSAPVC